MVQVIKVAPVDGGWAVTCEGATEPSLYFSGAQAEAIARRTAARVAGAGVDARVEVLDRNERHVGSHSFLA